MRNRAAVAPQPCPITTSMPIVTDQAMDDAAKVGRQALNHARETALPPDAEFTIDFTVETDKTTLTAAIARTYGDDTPSNVQFIGTDGRSATFKVLRLVR